MSQPLIQDRHPERKSDASPLVDISVGGRFWAFDLAKELLPYGMLRHLHTGYPAFTAKRFGLPPGVFRSVWTHGPVERFLSGLHARGLVRHRFDYALSSRFDRLVARRLRPGANLFVGWSSQCMRTLERASALGMATIVERGSAHIEWQRATLLEELERTGLAVEIPDARTVEQELAEYATADFIAVPAEFVARTFIERGIPRSRLLVNPYGVDVTRFDGRQEAIEPNGGQHGLRVIHVGRVSAQKGVQYLVPAVSKVAGATLTIVGPVEPGMEKVIHQPHTQVVGGVPGQDLPAYFAAADVYCLLSVQDGFAMTLAQAMAMGLPVIATTSVGAGELVTDGVEGFIVPPRDPDAVADRLQRLADDESLRKAMGARARAKVAQGFSWRDYGARARQVYTSIVQNRLELVA